MPNEIQGTYIKIKLNEVKKMYVHYIYSTQRNEMYVQ